MPLAFKSESHGTIAFGFFNIESDMLLLERHFFFATDFCAAICKMAKEQHGTVRELPFQAYVIENQANIGDLQGGIAGTHYSGFIGETYKKYPFPTQNNKFKQQTEGFRTRDNIEKIILDYAAPIDLTLIEYDKKGALSIGPYVFSRHNFLQLIEYVNQGGFPGWLEDVAPDYVVRMQLDIQESVLNRFQPPGRVF